MLLTKPKMVYIDVTKLRFESDNVFLDEANCFLVIAFKMQLRAVNWALPLLLEKVLIALLR